MLFEFNAQSELGPWPKESGEEPAVECKHHQTDLRCFMLQARMLITKCMFGIGDGDKIVRSLIKELVARAESYDLTGTAPIQPEGIDAFLAKLPANKNGDILAMPTIKQL